MDETLNDGCRYVTYKDHVTRGGDLVCRFEPKPLNATVHMDDVSWIEHSVDGLKLFSFLDAQGVVRLRSASTMFSEEINAAVEWLNSRQQAMQFVTDLTKRGYTVQLVWTISEIIAYPTASLQYICAIHNETGQYGAMANDLVVTINPDNIEYMTGIRGFLFRLKDGSVIEKQTLEFRLLNKAHTCLKNLIEACLLIGGLEKIKVMRPDCPFVAEIEEKIIPQYNQLILTSEIFYEDNKSLSRKDYYLKAKELFPDRTSILMQLYLHKPIEYRKWYIENALVTKNEAV